MMDSAPTDGSSLRWSFRLSCLWWWRRCFPLAILGKFQSDDFPLLVEQFWVLGGVAWSNLRWMFSTNLMGHYMP